MAFKDSILVNSRGKACEGKQLRKRIMIQMAIQKAESKHIELDYLSVLGILSDDEIDYY